jgi:septal ring factor EnvC (AmiA/AmiB activator)
MTDKNNDSIERNVKVNESRINAINREINDIVERIEELERENNELRSKLEDIQKENDRLRGEILSEKGINNISDAERVILSDWDSVSVRVTKNKKRAVSIVRNWSDVSWRNRNGESVMRFSEIEDYLDIRFTNAERVAKFVEKMTNGKIERVEDKEDDMVLVQKQDLATEVDDIMDD